MKIKTTVRYHFTPVRMAIIKKSTINAREGVEKGNPPTLLVGINYNGEQYGGSFKKTKNRVTSWAGNPTPEDVSGKDKNSNLKRYMHPNDHNSTIHNRQDVEVT